MDEKQIKFLAGEPDYISYFNMVSARDRLRVKVKFICSECGKESIKGLCSLHYPFVCSSCQMKISAREKHANEKRECTNKERYGVSNVMRSAEIKERQAQTVLRKYGVRNVLTLDNIQESRRQTLMNNYGVTNPMQSPEIRERAQETNLLRYGVKYATQSPQVQEKIKLTCNDRYGTDYVGQSQVVKDRIHRKRAETYLRRFNEQDSNILGYDGNTLTVHCADCGSDYSITPPMYYLRKRNHTKPCTLCNPINSRFSNYEKELYDYIVSLTSEPVERNRFGIIDRYELDIYLPEKKLAFEFDGLFWHSELYKEPDYHLWKTEECEKLNIRLIHVFEDEWVYRQDIVKSRIGSLLGVNKKIYARKCTVRTVPYGESKNFLDENHIQGNCMSTYRYGLYYDDTLVSVMTFGRSRFKPDEYELLRFCNKKYINVVGGASRLFTSFLNEHAEISKVISFADRRWSIGNLYEKIGFVKTGVTKPSYYYVQEQMRFNRIGFQKHKLVNEGFSPDMTEHEIMLSRKIYRIYDCGNLKYEYTRISG